MKGRVGVTMESNPSSEMLIFHDAVVGRCRPDPELTLLGVEGAFIVAHSVIGYVRIHTKNVASHVISVQIDAGI